MDLMHPGFAAGQQCSDLVVICLPSLKLSQFVQSGSFDLLRLPLCSCSCRPSPQSRSCAPLCYACLVSYVEVVCLVLLALPCSPLQAHLNASVKVGIFAFTMPRAATRAFRGFTCWKCVAQVKEYTSSQHRTGQIMFKVAVNQ